ncbi:hypothetical protein D3C77_649770 [compost metagenome]
MILFIVTGKVDMAIIYISQEDITNLISIIYEFVVDIDKQIIDGLLDSCSEHN